MTVHYKEFTQAEYQWALDLWKKGSSVQLIGETKNWEMIGSALTLATQPPEPKVSENQSLISAEVFAGEMLNQFSVDTTTFKIEFDLVNAAKLIKQRDEAIRQSERKKTRYLYDALGQIMDDMSPDDMSFPGHGCCEAAWIAGIAALTKFDSEGV